MTAGDYSELLVKGRDAFAAGNYIEARAYFEDLLKGDSENEQGKNLLAMTFVKLENYPSAIDLFKQLLRNNPEEINLLLNLGASYLKSDNPTDAIKIFQKIVELDASHTSAHNYMGMAYSKKNLYEKAIVEFKKSGNQKMVDRMKEKINERIKKKKTEKTITSVDLLDEEESLTPPPVAVKKADKPALPPPDSNFETFNDDTFFPADRGQIAESFFEDDATSPPTEQATKSDLPPLPDFDTDFPIDPGQIDNDLYEDSEPDTDSEFPVDRSAVADDPETDSIDITDFPIDPSAPPTAPQPPDLPDFDASDLPVDRSDLPIDTDLPDESDFPVPPEPEEHLDLGFDESTSDELFPGDSQLATDTGKALETLQSELESNSAPSEPTEDTRKDIIKPPAQSAVPAAEMSPLRPLPPKVDSLSHEINVDIAASRIWQLDTGALYCCPSADNCIFVREKRVIAVIGDLTGEPVKKMFKGKEMKSLFGGKNSPVYCYTGDGAIISQPEDGRYASLVRLDDNEIYISETNVLAFESSLKWQNGRLQLKGFADLDLVYFSGDGVIAIESPHRFNAIEIDGTKPFVATIDYVVGWMGKVSPELIVPKQDNAPPLLKFTGKGSILI